MAKKKKCNCWWFWIGLIIAEVSFYGFLYYVQYLLQIQTNLWISSLVLWALLNISILVCPMTWKCWKK